MLTERQQIALLTRDKTVDLISSNSNDSSDSDSTEEQQEIRTYTASNDQTPMQIAKELEIDVKLLVAWNKEEYNGIRAKSRLMEGTELRYADHFPPETATTSRAAKNSTPGPLMYTAQNDQMPIEIARELGIDVKILIAWNKDTYRGIKAKSRLMDGTELRYSHKMPAKEPSQPGSDAKDRSHPPQWSSNSTSKSSSAEDASAANKKRKRFQSAGTTSSTAHSQYIEKEYVEMKFRHVDDKATLANRWWWPYG